MNALKIETTTHPIVADTGPPYLRPVLYVTVIPASTDMIENEKAKLETTHAV